MYRTLETEFFPLYFKWIFSLYCITLLFPPLTCHHPRTYAVSHCHGEHPSPGWERAVVQQGIVSERGVQQALLCWRNKIHKENLSLRDDPEDERLPLHYSPGDTEKTIQFRLYYISIGRYSSTKKSTHHQLYMFSSEWIIIQSVMNHRKKKY